MKVSYLYHRFIEMQRRYVKGNVPFFRLCLYWCDWIISLIVQGASISDYFAYGFYKLRINGRNEFITYRRFHKIQRVLNDKKDIEICRDKSRFNIFFSEFLGRDWLEVHKDHFQEFLSFFKQHKVVFIKEVSGFRGVSTKKYIYDEVDVEQLFNSLVSAKNEKYIIEETMTQIACLREFHPWSINTVRIVTVYDNIHDCVHIMNARLRIGNKKNPVDNFHFDGIGANIDIDSGIINSVGYDVYNNRYVEHPITHKQIIGFKLPYWDACKQFITDAAKKLPTVRYVGWDLVILENGQFALLEANDNADHDFQQLYNKGLWREYKCLIAKIR